ncbi:hypothetical protein conserved [Leishmania donovani]|uniref:Hypothetical_protein_conserved n=1 Tax=Leishmania donovani TaxID=5661 RepID=A0A3Q8IGN7_LEIDO|nr:hypothetical protein, conserved [Leishmania donovani]AYU80239.1 hypothetical protein LdCL_280013500 [Leishmania donovani]CAJ1990228.1 hypothetical protein conserved [Leishmania donovani]CBZ35494.1 hypothetical protein, conserved [Leishmania donovani]VDZ46085.1 hypothetical_protein_conserved [Leishmania donovani]
MIAWTRHHHARCASLLRYRGEVLHFSADAQTGLVRLVACLCDSTAATPSGAGVAAVRDEEARLWSQEACRAQCVPFSSKQVFVSAAPLSADTTQDEDVLEATAACIFPCYISCGCPVVVQVSPGHHNSNSSEAEVMSVSCAPPSLRVKRLYVHNPAGSKQGTHDAHTASYYARLPDASFQCWQEHSKAVDGILDVCKGRPDSALHKRFTGLSSLDVEVLELLNLTKTLGCATGGSGTASVDFTRNTCGETAL